MPKRVLPSTIEETLAEMEVPLDQFARQVGMIADGMKMLTKSQLKESTIIMLIAKSSNVSQPDVKKVLEAMASLDQKYLKK